MSSNYLLPFVFLISLIACKTEKEKKEKTEIQLSDFHKVMILDSTAAAKAIIKDDIEHFFDSIRPIDMVIQMQNPSVSAHANRDSVLVAYKKFIQEDVADFKKDEIEFIAKTLAEAFELCNKAALKYFPEEIKLVKTHGKHYGDDTYYTRENIIVIPKAALKKKDADEFLKVLLHEISHIITRLNPSVKTSLYALIGFNPIEQPLVMNDSLKQRVLINPDGSDLKWITELTTADGKNVKAMPLIYANETDLVKSKNSFFQYLGFNFFEVNPAADQKSWILQTIGNQQKSTLNTEGINAIYRQKFNTEYIIHPDEIIADNFSIGIYALKKPQSLSIYTEGGKDLIKKIGIVLSQK